MRADDLPSCTTYIICPLCWLAFLADWPHQCGAASPWGFRVVPAKDERGEAGREPKEVP